MARPRNNARQNAVARGRRLSNQRARRSNETASQRQARLAQDRQYRRNRRAALTDAQRAAENAQVNELHVEQRAREDSSQRSARLENDHARYVARSQSSQGSLMLSQPAAAVEIAPAPAVAVPPRRPRLFMAAVLTNEGKLRDGLPQEDYLGPLDQQCTNCGALHFVDERKRNCRQGTYSDCCDFGKMDPALFDLPPYPAAMQALFENRHFMANINYYNDAMAMGSLSYRYVRPNSPGPQLFKVAGAVYHCIYNINDGRSNRNSHIGKCNQLWFLDTQEANEQRIERQSVLVPDILTTLKHELERANNALYGEYQSMQELVNQNPGEYVLRFDSRRVDVSDFSHRQYDLPTTRQIAAVVVERNEDSVRGIYAYHRRSNYRQFFDYTEGICDALTYPILFPHGQVEWHKDRPKVCHVVIFVRLIIILSCALEQQAKQSR
jgi:hypothetical protein